MDELKTAVRLEVCPCISAEDQTVNGLGLVGHAISAADSQFCCCCVQSAVGDTNPSECSSVFQ